jgi:hypothetical protein
MTAGFRRRASIPWAWRASTAASWASRTIAKWASVAVARKLAIIMHRMWRENTDFQYGTAPQRLAKGVSS